MNTSTSSRFVNSASSSSAVSVSRGRRGRGLCGESGRGRRERRGRLGVERQREEVEFLRARQPRAESACAQRREEDALRLDVRPRSRLQLRVHQRAARGLRARRLQQRQPPAGTAQLDERRTERAACDRRDGSVRRDAQRRRGGSAPIGQVRRLVCHQRTASTVCVEFGKIYVYKSIVSFYTVDITSILIIRVQ